MAYNPNSRFCLNRVGPDLLGFKFQQQKIHIDEPTKPIPLKTQQTFLQASI